MFRLLLRIGILAVMILALAIPKVDARAAPANAAALASQRRALLSARPPRNERRSLIEVATQGLFDLFGFEVGASATYDPLCEFVNPMLDAENKLNCGGDYA